MYELRFFRHFEYQNNITSFFLKGKYDIIFSKYIFIAFRISW
jgi:hypothetical protein